MVIVVLSDDRGDADWAGHVLGELLGTPGIDVRLVEFEPGELAIGSTARLMWDQMQPPVLIVADRSYEQTRAWLDGEGITRSIADASADHFHPRQFAWSILSTGGSAALAVQRIRGIISEIDRGDRKPGLAESQLDDWITSLEDDPNF